MTLGYWKSNQHLGFIPVQAILFVWKIVDNIGPNEVSASTMVGTKSNNTIKSLLNLIFRDLILLVSDPARHANVDLFHMSEKYQQVRIKRSKLLHQICFFKCDGKTEVDRSPAWPNVAGELGPDGRYHTKKLALI
jgi:hypothetical protein